VQDPPASLGPLPAIPVGPVGPWQLSRVVAVTDETPTAKTFRLRLQQPGRFVPGQHFVVRLTAPDGYRTQRSYSVASAPDDLPEIELTVERLADGEVSGFLHEGVVVGDELEVRGPIGGFFVWDGRPALLVGGGSGVVPLMSILRHARRTGREHLLRLLVSARSPDHLYYAGEIEGPETTVVYTRTVRAGGRARGPDTRRTLRPHPLNGPALRGIHLTKGVCSQPKACAHDQRRVLTLRPHHLSRRPRRCSTGSRSRRSSHPCPPPTALSRSRCRTPSRAVSRTSCPPGGGRAFGVAAEQGVPRSWACLSAPKRRRVTCPRRNCGTRWRGKPESLVCLRMEQLFGIDGRPGVGLSMKGVSGGAPLGMPIVLAAD